MDTSREMTKKELVKALAEHCEAPPRAAEAFLDALVAIAYHEAARGFSIPGLCKLDVVHRKARRCRHPRTGQRLLIGARQAVRIRPLKKARDRITPAPPGLVTVLDEAPVSDTPPAPAFLTFVCPGCKAELEASWDLAGSSTSCPSCHRALEVPGRAAAHGPASEGGFIAFRCSACEQEIEVSRALGGTESECPACGGRLAIPLHSTIGPDAEKRPMSHEEVEALKSRTVRIELPDEVLAMHD